MTMTAEPEIYPMPAFPTLKVRDIVASTRWYQDVVNFQLVFEMPDSTGRTLLSHLRWAKYADLLLVPEPAEISTSDPKGIGVTLTFMLFEGSVDRLAAQAQAGSATILHQPVTQPWGCREVTIADPDGYRLVFGQRVVEQEFEQILNAVANNE